MALLSLFNPTLYTSAPEPEVEAFEAGFNDEKVLVLNTKTGVITRHEGRVVQEPKR